MNDKLRKEEARRNFARRQEMRPEHVTVVKASPGQKEKKQ